MVRQGAAKVHYGPLGRRSGVEEKAELHIGPYFGQPSFVTSPNPSPAAIAAVRSNLGFIALGLADERARRAIVGRHWARGLCGENGWATPLEVCLAAAYVGTCVCVRVCILLIMQGR